MALFLHVLLKVDAEGFDFSCYLALISQLLLDSLL